MDGQSGCNDFARVEAEFKKDKCRAKTTFSRSRTKLLQLLQKEELPSRRDVLEACNKLDSTGHFLKFLGHVYKS